MRILFAGSPAIAVPCLEALSCMKEIELAGVLTNPDTPKGRHGDPAPTEIGAAAQRLNISPVLKPVKLDAAAREQVSALKCDLLISFACGHFFGPKFLTLFPMGGINIHPSLLPKYRGPSPVQAAILNRDTITGISIQTLADKMDCGDIYAVEQIQLTGRETNVTLSNLIAQKAAVMLPDIIKKIADGTAKTTEQNHSEATHCKLFTKDDGIINWNQSAADIDAKIRAFNPWPLCSSIHNGRDLFILESDIYKGGETFSCGALPGKVLGTDRNCGILIQTGDGILAVTMLQYQAKKALFWRDFLNGARDFLSSQL